MCTYGADVKRRVRISLLAAGWGFVAPAFVIYAVFVLYPLVKSLQLSFTDWDGVSAQKTYVGLANFREMFKDPLVWESLVHNVEWVVIGTALPLVLGLALALFASEITRLRLLFRTVFFIPYILAPSVMAVIWNWLYDPTFGAFNAFLSETGLSRFTLGWLGDPRLALYLVLLVAIWAYTGFVFVVFMAALQTLDRDLQEAARLDGAGYFRIVYHVTVPQLRNSIDLLMVLGLIGGFAVFDIVYIMTSGGPGSATEVIATYAYRAGFVETRVGYASAMTVLMTLLALVSAVAFAVARQWRDSE